LAAGAVTLNNTVGIDVVSATGVTITTTDKTSTSGNLKAGTHTGIQSVTGLTGADADNYTFADVKGDYQVKKKEINLTGLVAQNKAFDNSTVATLTGTPTLVDVIGVDIVALEEQPTANFENALVGDNKPVTVLAALNGNDRDNYTLVLPTNLTANITGAVEPIDPPGPVVPPTPPSPNNNTVVVAGGSNSFQLAGAEATCSADTLEQCECESATSTAGVAMTGVQICYEPNTRPSSAL
jgi:hypothetical protein